MTETISASPFADETSPRLTLVSQPDWPAVSVVMTVLNEARHLADSVSRILAQEYAGELELVIALGPSKDATDRIARRLAFEDPRIKLVGNPTGRTPAGLNAAVLAASHGIIARVDGHGALLPGLHGEGRPVAREDRRGERRWSDARGRGDRLRAGGCPGVLVQGGSRRWHLPRRRRWKGPAESVYLGVFRREVLERLGGFNDHYHRAQDWELNFRIRQAGELVWFSPDLAVTYRPRSSWPELVRQFFHTGRWRREVIRQYPDTACVALSRPAGRHRCHRRRDGRRDRRYRRGGAPAPPRMAGSPALRARRAHRLLPRGPWPAVAGPGAAPGGAGEHAPELGVRIPVRPPSGRPSAARSS